MVNPVVAQAVALVMVVEARAVAQATDNPAVAPVMANLAAAPVMEVEVRAVAQATDNPAVTLVMVNRVEALVTDNRVEALVTDNLAEAQADMEVEAQAVALAMVNPVEVQSHKVVTEIMEHKLQTKTSTKASSQTV